MRTVSDECAKYCSDLGWFLVAIPAGTKGPISPGWQKPERAIYTPEAARDYWDANPSHNVGLLHSASGTVALDVDHVEHTKLIFEHLGIDYEAIMASAPRIVGRKDRGKVLFRAPKEPLKTHKISWPVDGDPRKTEVVFELRAGSVQDVLPPSIHPDTGNPYTWAGPSIYDGLPELPASLFTLWNEWDRFRGQLQDMCPWRTDPPIQPPRKVRIEGDRTSVIGAFNDAHEISSLLVRFGYKPTGRGRHLSPNSTSGLAGVVVFEDGNAYSHHASDPFDSAHTFDAFDLWCHYEHMGDVTKAVREASQFLNISQDPTHKYDEEAIRHGGKVSAMILPSRQANVSKGPLSDIPEHLLSVPGRLNDVVTYYNSTAPKDQPQFAVQAALAFGAVVMGRRWVTDQNNMTGLYFVNVGKTAAGKEHAKTVLEKMLDEAQLDNLIGPSGYTSSSGVFSALTTQPNHLTIIDELGRVLGSSNATGNHHKADAQTIIMEIFGRQSSALRPQGYSKMGANKTQSDNMDKIIRSPSLTIMSMTTPETLYDNLSSRYVADGFLGRFLIVESNIGRQTSKKVRRVQVGEQIIEWAKEHATASEGGLGQESAEMPPIPVEVAFCEACDPIMASCDADMIGLMDEYEKDGLDGMFGRTKEIAQRIALIIARSKGEDVISPESLQWAVDYATFYAQRTVTALKGSLADGPFEAACKAVMRRIEVAGLKGATEREIAKHVRVFAGMEPRRRKEVMEALVSDMGIACRNMNEGKKGRPRMAWFAAGDE